MVFNGNVYTPHRIPAGILNEHSQSRGIRHARHSTFTPSKVPSDSIPPADWNLVCAVIGAGPLDACELCCTVVLRSAAIAEIDQSARGVESDGKLRPMWTV